MKKVTLTVEIEFTHDVPESYQKDLAEKVSNALYSEVMDGLGLNPDDEDNEALTDVITTTIPKVIQIVDKPFGGPKLTRDRTFLSQV